MQSLLMRLTQTRLMVMRILAFAANDVITVGYEFDATDNYATDFDAVGRCFDLF